MEYGNADVRASNCTGSIGDKQFVEVLSKVQSPMTFAHSSWRMGVVAAAAAPLALLPWLGKWAANSSEKWYVRVPVALSSVLCLLPMKNLASQVLMVKQGEVFISQLTEDGTTQLLLSGIHVLPCVG